VDHRSGAFVGIDTSKLRNAVAVADLLPQAAVTVTGALTRQESRGAHFREDFPKRLYETWMKHTLAWADDAATSVRVDHRPIHTKTLTNDVQYFPPQKQIR
jgi:succinate dehydrogenase / fumarate reductase, flavoprotein subunit